MTYRIQSNTITASRASPVLSPPNHPVIHVTYLPTNLPGNTSYIGSSRRFCMPARTQLVVLPLTAHLGAVGRRLVL